MKTPVPLLWIVSFLFLSCPSPGQGETWSLKRCIRYAKSHNIQIQQQELQAHSAQITYRQSRLSQLPRLSGSASLGKNFGRSIDPTTNQFVSNNLTSSGIGVNAQVTLFSFLKLRNTIDAARFTYRANNMIIKQMMHDLSLNITNAYLQILLAEDQIKISEKQVHLTKNQLKATRQKVMAGVLSVGEEANLRAQ